MSFPRQFKHHLLDIDARSFEAMAMELFQWQAEHNSIYQTYLSHLNINPKKIKSTENIPFLPIEFFKHHQVVTKNTAQTQFFFESSGTTGQTRSRHYIADLPWYYQVCQRAFERQWGPLTDFHIFALLPSYLERKNASLVAMADFFIEQSQSAYSGFYLNNFEKLVHQVEAARQTNRRILLLGVTFALLTLAETYRLQWPEVVIMETGGMKGRRKEITRAEVHNLLATGLGVTNVASEYGMTELLSQAYSRVNGQFTPPPWMKIRIRDTYDPFSPAPDGRQGGINVIDLANVDSCAFVETKDLGRRVSDESFEVLGRFDNSEVRGCSLMI
jgi:phenylacetate-coenzyme A ligase PaaK-like adenylate-forming protein